MFEGAASKDTCAVEANAFLGKPNLQASAKRTELNVGRQRAELPAKSQLAYTLYLMAKTNISIVSLGLYLEKLHFQYP